MTKIDQETFICLDCETTGLDVVKDEIIEVAVVKFTTNKSLEEYGTLVDPKKTIPKDSIEIHHITPQMVEGKPTIDELKAILERDEDEAFQILPNVEIRPVNEFNNRRISGGRKPITLREDLGGEYGQVA